MTQDDSSTAGADTEPWWRGAVVYQIYPRSYQDTTGDGVGDLKGITDRLDHVASLGVDAIWISPFYTSPMKDYGYDVADYCDVDPVFGTLDDFDRLIERAHGLGLRVIIDQVYAHTSDQHAWFAESRADRNNAKSDWYVWADAKPDGSPPSNWQSVFGGPAWTWDSRRQQYYMHNFLVEQPQLNLHNPDVQDALLDVARFWLDRGVDGFRLDAINFAMHDPALTDNPPSSMPLDKVTRPFDLQLHLHNQSQPGIVDFLERLRAVIDSYGERFTVAEVVGADPVPEMKAYTEGSTRLSSAYNFDFLYARSISPRRIRRSLETWVADAGEGWPSWAFSNHDAPRAVSRWAPEGSEDQFARLACMLLLSLRGNPFLYQGEELGLPQAEIPFDRLRDPEAIANWPRTLGRDGARTPMPWASKAPGYGFTTGESWLPVDPRHGPLAVEQQEDDAQSCLNTVRFLIHQRRDLQALKTGAFDLLKAQKDGLLAFARRDSSGDIVCLFNLSAVPVRQKLVRSGTLLATEAGKPADETPVPETMAALSGMWIRPDA